MDKIIVSNSLIRSILLAYYDSLCFLGSKLNVLLIIEGKSSYPSLTKKDKTLQVQEPTLQLSDLCGHSLALGTLRETS